MAASRRAITVAASIVAAGSFAGIAGAEIGVQVASTTPADVHVLLTHEQSVVNVLRRFPGVHSPTLGNWEQQFHAAAGAQAAAIAKVNSDLKPAATATSGPEAAYKASARSIPYPELTKNPSALKGRVVTYRVEVFQYDSNTGTSHFLGYVTPQPFWENLVLFDVNPKIAMHACNNSVLQVWGSVVGAYTYATNLNGSNTVPEVNVKYLSVLQKPC